MSKKITMIGIVCLAFLFVAIINTNVVNAEEETTTKIGLGIDSEEIGLPEIDTKYIPSCPHPSGRHYMTGRGTGWAYYGAAPSTDLRLTGQASQCENCNVVLITENNLFLNPSLPWGKYAMWNPGYKVGNGVVMYTTSFGEINTKNDPFALGFEFH